MMMTVAHIEASRILSRTGISRHIVQVVERLLVNNGMELTLFGSDPEVRGLVEELGKPWTDARLVTYGCRSKLMRKLWAALNYPRLESWIPDPDWLYLPADSYVPTRRARVAMTVHDMYTQDTPVPYEDRWRHCIDGLRFRYIYRRAKARAAKFLAVSTFTADRIMALLGVPANRVKVVGNGVAEVFFDPPVSRWQEVSHSFALAEGRFVIVVGGLKPKKNAHGIIAAWQIVEQKHEHVKLLVVGKNHPKWQGRARRKLRNLAFVRYVEDDVLAVLYAKSAALLFPSFYEGFGIPALEAMAAGTPAVVSNAASFPEVCGDAALFVDPSDPRDIARNVLRCMEDDSLRSELAQSGPAQAMKHSWDAVAGRIVEALHAS